MEKPLIDLNQRLTPDFYIRDVLEVAPQLLGKILVRTFENGTISRFKITETEAYRGEEDLACHASKGRTPRTEIMFHEGGKVYVYLIYGMYWMLNVVAGNEGNPSAVLIRGIEGVDGPGRVGKLLQLDRSFYGESLINSSRIWIENSPNLSTYSTSKRIGIDYSGLEWTEKPWRFQIDENY